MPSCRSFFAADAQGRFMKSAESFRLGAGDWRNRLERGVGGGGATLVVDQWFGTTCGAASVVVGRSISGSFGGGGLVYVQGSGGGRSVMSGVSSSKILIHSNLFKIILNSSSFFPNPPPEMAMSTEFTKLFPNLPEELALECLTRLNYVARRIGALVCRRWSELLLSRDFFYHQKRTGFTQKPVVMVQSILVQGEIPVCFPSYRLTIYYPDNRIWDRVDPVPQYPYGLPLFYQVVSSKGKLVVMGGLDPTSWEPVRDVFVYEFTTGSWIRRKDMPSCRSFFAASTIDDVVFVAGGHDVNKNVLSTAWKYDIRADEWTELPGMNEERDECAGIVVGSEFWVVSGYATQAQGRFMKSVESFGLGTGDWRFAQDA
ncbi:hypothetical protein RHGRI_007391 [Rhododendron griersonianum]|uniref:F-box domain-containing protein n=1 Tax=Rhododendron griersonianum TaxID=479676 RepID=A0AAV6KWQ9_9ERIC|nr:hypothetical protein RHGRI_007391 [Rhododendron griersonianum]